MRTLALLGGCALVIGGCSGTPAGPTALQGTHQPVILASGSSDLAPLAVEAARLTADDFAARGWECRLAPVPGRTVCSRPTQSFPSVPPPDDRPRTVTLLAWQDGNLPASCC